MILKKPFGFLIKNFRKIHLLVTILMAYSSFKLFKLNSFFNTLANSDSISNVPSNLLNIYLFIDIILLLVFSVFMYILMKKKSKPTKFYLFMIIYYAVLIIMYAVASSVLKSITQLNVISLEMSRAYRDVSAIFSYPQYILILYALFRTIGFDIKKFDFGKDLKELEISQTDDEEFEFVVGFDFSKILVKIRKRMRELRYYFLENTKIFGFLFLGIIAIVGGIFGYNAIFGKKVYNQAETFNVANYQVTVLNSYISNLSQRGDVVNENTYYLVINLKIKNLTAKDVIINTSDFKVAMDETYYFANYNSNDYFVDLGKPYNNQSLEPKTDYSYLLIYEIEKANIAQDYQLKISGDFSFNSEGNKVYKYKYVNLKPTILDNLVELQNIDFNADSTTNILNFEDSLLGETYLKFKSYQITPSFQYTYNKCYSSTECYDLVGFFQADNLTFNSTLLVIDTSLTLSKSCYYSLNNYNIVQFYNNFVKVQYVTDGEVKTMTPKLKNSSTYTDKIVLEVPQSVTTSSRLSLLFTIRNKRYTINLK